MQGGDAGVGTERLRVLIEGWRGVPHSYCVVLMHTCAELLERGDCDVRFIERPLYDPTWKRISGVLAGDGDARVAAIPPPEAGWEPRVIVRGDYPMRMDPHATARVVAVGTTEFGMAVPGAVGGADLKRVDGRRVVIATCSNWSRDGFLRSGAPGKGVALVPLGVDTSTFRPPTPRERAAAREWVGVDPSRFVFLSLGAMTENKGVGSILAGFGQTVLERPRAALVLKGLSGMYASEQRVLSVLDTFPPEAWPVIHGNLRFMGEALSLADMARLYHAADAYLAPYTAEGFCMPALEASACGLPVLCTKGGPTDEFLPKAGNIFIASDRQPYRNEPQKTGLFVRMPAVLEAMKRVMSDAPLRAAALREGPRNARDKYTWARSAALLRAVMEPVE